MKDKIDKRVELNLDSGRTYSEIIAYILAEGKSECTIIFWSSSDLENDKKKLRIYVPLLLAAGNVSDIRLASGDPFADRCVGDEYSPITFTSLVNERTHSPANPNLRELLESTASFTPKKLRTDVDNVCRGQVPYSYIVSKTEYDNLYRLSFLQPGKRIGFYHREEPTICHYRFSVTPEGRIKLAPGALKFQDKEIKLTFDTWSDFIHTISAVQGFNFPNRLQPGIAYEQLLNTSTFNL
jgi:hypothetical protein